MNAYQQFIENATPTQVAAYVSVFVPLLVELLTKINVNNRVKAILNLILTALAANVGLLVVQGTGDWNWNQFIQAWVVASATSIGAYVGIWKPTKVAAKVDAATPQIGTSIGQDAHDEDEIVSEDEVIGAAQEGDEVEGDPLPEEADGVVDEGDLEIVDTSDVNGRVPGDPDPGPDAVPADEEVDPTAGTPDQG